MLAAWLIGFPLHFSELVLSWYSKCDWNAITCIYSPLLVVGSSFKSFTAARLHFFSEYSSHKCSRIYTVVCHISNVINQWIWCRLCNEFINNILEVFFFFTVRKANFNVWIVTVLLCIHHKYFCILPKTKPKWCPTQTCFSSALHNITELCKDWNCCPLLVAGETGGKKGIK